MAQPELDRMAAVDRNLLRLAVYELLHQPAIPAKVVINEAVELAKRYGRDEKAANSHNYAAGMMVAQIATETIKRAKAKGKKVTKESLYEEILAMNGDNSYSPGTTVGPVTFSKTDKAGVDTLQLYVAKNGGFHSEGKPFIPEYTAKIK